MASWMNMYCSWRRIIQHIHIIAKAHIFHFYIKPLTKSTTHTVCNIDNTNSCEHADGQREREVTDGKWRYEWDEMTTVEFLVHFTSGTRYFWIFGSSKWTDREWTEGCCGEWIRSLSSSLSCCWGPKTILWKQMPFQIKNKNWTNNTKQIQQVFSSPLGVSAWMSLNVKNAYLFCTIVVGPSNSEWPAAGDRGN